MCVWTAMHDFQFCERIVLSCGTYLIYLVPHDSLHNSCPDHFKLFGDTRLLLSASVFSNSHSNLVFTCANRISPSAGPLSSQVLPQWARFYDASEYPEFWWAFFLLQVHGRIYACALPKTLRHTKFYVLLLDFLEFASVSFKKSVCLSWSLTAPVDTVAPIIFRFVWGKEKKELIA